MNAFAILRIYGDLRNRQGEIRYRRFATIACGFAMQLNGASCQTRELFSRVESTNFFFLMIRD